MVGKEGLHPDSLPAKVRLISEHKNRPDVRVEAKENESIRERLCCVVRKAGEKILEYKGPIVDTGTSRGHDLSSIDEYARSVVNNALDGRFSDRVPRVYPWVNECGGDIIDG